MDILNTLRKIEEKIEEYSYNFDNALLEEINNSFKTLNDVKDPKTLSAIWELQNAKHSVERFLETHNDEYLDEYNKYFDSAKTLLGHIEANEVEKELITNESEKSKVLFASVEPIAISKDQENSIAVQHTKPWNGNSYILENSIGDKVRFDIGTSFDGKNGIIDISYFVNKNDAFFFAAKDISLNDIKTFDNKEFATEIAEEIFSRNYQISDLLKNEKEILTSAFKAVAEKTNTSKNIKDVIENAENVSQAASLITDYTKERLENRDSASTKEKIIEVLKNLPEDEVNTLFESGELFENVKDMIEDKNLKPDVTLE